jgi:ribonuclease HI
MIGILLMIEESTKGKVFVKIYGEKQNDTILEMMSATEITKAVINVKHVQVELTKDSRQCVKSLLDAMKGQFDEAGKR